MEIENWPPATANKSNLCTGNNLNKPAFNTTDDKPVITKQRRVLKA